MKKTPIGFDIEGSTKEPITAEIASIQLYLPDQGKTVFIPIKMRGMEPVDPVPILHDIADRYTVVGHYLNYDLALARKYGVTIQPYADTLYYFNMTPLASAWSKDKRGLKDLCEELGIAANLDRFEDAVPSLDFTKVSIDDDRAINYAKADPKLTWDLWKYLERNHPDNLQAFRSEMQAYPYFINMTVQGMALDSSQIPQIEVGLSAELASLNKELAQIVGFPFKANSNKELVPVWEKLGLDLPPTTPKGVHSFKAENLDLYLPNPVVEKIIEARGLIYILPRLRNTLEKYVINDRLHPTYNITGWTGGARVYTQGPSTNSLPTAVRRHVLPEPGKKFVYADWGQAEFMLAAFMAREKDICIGYLEGDDVMRIAAARNFDCSPEEVSDDQREVQKVVQYASMYGSEGISVSKALKIPVIEGVGKVNRFWESLPQMAGLRDFIIQKAHENGYTQTLTGFKRFLPNINSDSIGQQKESERKAFNSAMQSGVANLFKLAVVRLHTILPEGCRMVTGVFDSFLLEVPEDMPLEEIRPIFGSISRFDIDPFHVRFRFSLSEGKNWAEAMGK